MTLNIEIWPSILACEVISHGSFTSVEDLEANVLAFIDSYHARIAILFKWASQGKALTFSTPEGFRLLYTSALRQKEVHDQTRRCKFT